MISRADRFRYLMSLAFAGEATAEELLELKQLINTDTAAKAEFDEAISNFSQEDVSNCFARFDNTLWAPLETLESRPKPYNKGRLIRITVLAAAAMIGVFFISRIFVPHNFKASEQVAVIAKKNVELQLASGEVLDLSQATGQNMQYNGAILMNDNKTLSYSFKASDKDNAALAGTNILNVPIGLDYHLELEDGTQVWLNSATQLKFPLKFSKDSRNVTIKGEAYFEIAKDANRPFLVNINHGAVKVLGTSFNINNYDPEDIRVALVEGSVQVQHASSQMVIKPGFEASAGKSQEISVKPFDADEVLAWRSGRFYFNDKTVQEIMQVIPRLYGVNVQIDNPTIKEKLFTGVINRHKPLTLFLDKMKLMVKMDYYFDKQGILHIR